MYKKASYFTLMEILVALLIMALGLSAAFSITSRATDDALGAQEKWANAHLSDLACEFFLLAGPEAPIPDNLFPKSFTADCEVELITNTDKIEELPEFAQEPISGWILAVYNITVYKDGEAIQTRRIEKIVKEEKFQ